MLINDIVNHTITALGLLTINSICFSDLEKLLPAVLTWLINVKVRKTHISTYKLIKCSASYYSCKHEK